MFRAIDTRKQLRVYILGDEASDLKELAELASSKKLVCEYCRDPLQMVRGHKGIWHFKHYPSVLGTPPCIFRGKNLRNLLRLQVDIGVHSRHQQEIILIEKDEYFRISDEARSYLDALKRNEALRKREVTPIILVDLNFYCEHCAETRTNWVVIDYDTRVGICRECLKAYHDEEVWVSFHDYILFYCEHCGETKAELKPNGYNSGVGSCLECSTINYEEQIWTDLQLTIIQHIG